MATKSLTFIFLPFKPSNASNLLDSILKLQLPSLKGETCTYYSEGEKIKAVELQNDIKTNE